MFVTRRPAIGLRSSATAALALLLCLPLTAATARADDLVVEYDQARLLRLPEPAESIIIGNPSIADITLKSPTLLIVTGKTFGVTNMIILNKDEKVVLSQRLMVKSDDRKVVSLQRGTTTSTFNCIPKCEPMIKIGDEPGHLGELAKSAQTKMKFSEGDSSSSGDAN